MATQKERFLKRPYAKVLADITASEDFKDVVNMVMIDLVDGTQRSENANEAAAVAYRMEGAKRFRDSLMSFAVPATPAKQLRGDNLPHE